MTQIQDLADYATTLGRNARKASAALVRTGGQLRTQALLRMAAAIREQSATLQAANQKDLSAATANNLSAAMIDRLTLDGARVEKIAAAVEEVAAQADPVGEVVTGYVRPNGLRIQKVRVPLGVVAIIYEARPNVTSDAAALCLKSGNACILRGGKESFHTNIAIGSAISSALSSVGLDPNAVQLVETTDRALVPALLKLDEYIDVVIPRGGESLIRAVVKESTIPVIKHYTGNCHVYVHSRCDHAMAESIVLNAKLQRPGVCNAAETILFDAAVAGELVPRIGGKLVEAGCEVRGCEKTRALLPAAKAATEDDWRTEYLDRIVAMRVVDGLEAAVEHINRYGSRHTDAILTADLAAAEAFAQAVDAASVMVNCSTRFSDGGEYGLGAEIGISTDKLHARGPMGAADLTTYKYVVTGSGQIRT
ncbi:MAG: glutamate-5-semialdehyde dehydrogenase [Phycisphaerae bacterium]|nr:glutamate-5-semialdehyde dehydrogenase [Phycisphaerae bacterium]